MFVLYSLLHVLMSQMYPNFSFIFILTLNIYIWIDVQKLPKHVISSNRIMVIKETKYEQEILYVDVDFLSEEVLIEKNNLRNAGK